MMDYYFDQAFTMLKKWDLNSQTNTYNHSDKEYQMLLLTGMNNPGDNASVTQIQLLQNEYNTLKTRFGITDAEITIFLDSQKNATSNKLLIIANKSII